MVNKFTALSVFSLLITGCTYDSTPVLQKALPSCSQITPILQSSAKEFDSIKVGPKIYSSTGGNGYWQSKIKLPDADECIIKENYSSGFQFRCAWYHGDDKSAMGQHYQNIRDRIISCVGNVNVRRNDRQGITTIWLEPYDELSSLKYVIRAQYEHIPYSVKFDVEAQ